MFYIPRVKSFVDWLVDELKARNVSQAELAKRSGMSQASISLVISGKRNPGIDFCNAVAKALNIPTEEVLSSAGLLPKKSIRTALIDRMVELFSNFSVEEQEAYLEEMDFRLERKRRKDYASHKVHKAP